MKERQKMNGQRNAHMETTDYSKNLLESKATVCKIRTTGTIVCQGGVIIWGGGGVGGDYKLKH